MRNLVTIVTLAPALFASIAAAAPAPPPPIISTSVSKSGLVRSTLSGFIRLCDCKIFANSTGTLSPLFGPILSVSKYFSL